jgi:hypothetical protein
LVLCQPPQLLVAELKLPGRHPTAAQRGWLTALAACGVECWVWTPDCWQRIVARLQAGPQRKETL